MGGIKIWWGESTGGENFLSIQDFFIKRNQIRRKLISSHDLVTFTEEILNGKLYFCAVCVNVNNSAFGTFYYYLLKS